MAAHAGVPVVNALTDSFHPCQILADLAAVADARGGVDALAGLTLTYVGDGANNMAHSLPAGRRARRHARARWRACRLPAQARPFVLDAKRIAADNGGSVTVTTDVDDAVAGTDVIATDTWVSMGDEDRRGSGPASSRRTRSTRARLSSPTTALRCSTACPRTAARRSPPTCSTARSPSCGSRPSTACTPKRRC